MATSEMQSAIVAMEVITNKLKISKMTGGTITADTLLTNLGKASSVVTSNKTKKLTATEAEAGYAKVKIPKAFVTQAQSSLKTAISLSTALGIDTTDMNGLQTTLSAISTAIGSGTGLTIEELVTNNVVDVTATLTKLSGAETKVGTAATKVTNGEANSSLSGALAAGDVAALSVSPTTLTLAEGASGTLSVSLSRTPSATVTVAVTSSSADATVLPASLTFTTANWASAQTVTVSATDNTALDGNKSATVTLNPDSTDTGYSALANTTVAVTVTDNEPTTNTFRIQNDTLNFNGIAATLTDFTDSDGVELSNQFQSVSFTAAPVGTYRTDTVPVKVALGIASTTTSSAMTVVIDSANFVFDGTDLSITVPTTAVMYVAGTSYTGNSASVAVTNAAQKLFTTSGGTFTVTPTTILSEANRILGNAGSAFDVLSSGSGSFTVTMAVSGVNFNISGGASGTTAASTITIGSGSDSNYVLSGPGISGKVTLVNRTPAELVSNYITTGKQSIADKNNTGGYSRSGADIKADFKSAYDWSQSNTVSTNTKDVSRVLYALARAVTAGTTASSNASGSFTTAGSMVSGYGCTLSGSSFTLTSILASQLDQIDCPRSSALPGTAPTGSEALLFMKTSVYDELSAVLTLLDGVTSTYSDTWTANDFGAEFIDYGEVVDVDYGDVLVFKGWIKYVMAQILINASYDMNVDIDATLGTAGGTFQTFLTNNSSALGLGTDYLTNLDSAKMLLSSAVDDFRSAITFIGAETDDQSDDLMDLTAADRTTADAHLQDFQSSLSGATTFTEGTSSLSLDVSRFFTGLSIRAVLPTISGDEVTSLFPDSTMGGIFPNDAYNFAGESLNNDPNMNSIPEVLESNGKFSDFLWIPFNPNTQPYDNTTISADGNTYYILFSGTVAEPSALYAVNLTTEAVADPVTVNVKVRYLAGVASDGRLVAITQTGQNMYGIALINPGTGAVQELVALDPTSVIANANSTWINGALLNSAGDTLYAVVGGYDTQYVSAIASFNLTTLSFGTPVVLSGNNFMPFQLDGSGNLLGTFDADYNDPNSTATVQSVNLTSGVATQVGSLPTMKYVSYLKPNPAGTAMYASGSGSGDRIVTYNLSSNTASLTTYLNRDFSGAYEGSHIEAMGSNGRFITHHRNNYWNVMVIGFLTP